MSGGELKDNAHLIAQLRDVASRISDLDDHVIVHLAADALSRPSSPLAEARRGALEEAERTANLMGVVASRIKTRIDAMVERDGSVDNAITGRGVGIGYLLAKELHTALVRGEAAIRALKD